MRGQTSTHKIANTQCKNSPGAKERSITAAAGAVTAQGYKGTQLTVQRLRASCLMSFLTPASKRPCFA